MVRVRFQAPRLFELLAKRKYFSG